MVTSIGENLTRRNWKFFMEKQRLYGKQKIVVGEEKTDGKRKQLAYICV